MWWSGRSSTTAYGSAHACTCFDLVACSLLGSQLDMPGPPPNTHTLPLTTFDPHRAAGCQPARGLGGGVRPQRQALLLAQGNAKDAVGQAHRVAAVAGRRWWWQQRVPARLLHNCACVVVGTQPASAVASIPPASLRFSARAVYIATSDTAVCSVKNRQHARVGHGCGVSLMI